MKADAAFTTASESMEGCDSGWLPASPPGAARGRTTGFEAPAPERVNGEVKADSGAGYENVIHTSRFVASPAAGGKPRAPQGARTVGGPRWKGASFCTGLIRATGGSPEKPGRFRTGRTCFRVRL
jgi:hypothetical protein